MIVSRETIAQLFAHESTRVFHDRLTDDNDRKTFYQFLSDDLHNYFKVKFFVIFSFNYQLITFCSEHANSKGSNLRLLR